MAIYLTKYALTNGVITMHAVSPGDDGYARVKPKGQSYANTYSPSAFATSETEAISQATSLRARKIASLKKQIAKLEAMTFVIEPA